MFIFKLITALMQNRRQTRPTPRYAQEQPETPRRPQPSPAPTTALRGTIILPTVTPMPQQSAAVAVSRRHAWERRRAAYYQTLPPSIERVFPSNHARQCWKIEQSNRRWLYHHNRPFYEELKRVEGWVWE